ncbi:MAG: four helix bundle protein [Acidobacteria bacterium]|nr:four helix bundle protein [Acidobacteriota bacterium]
MGSILTYRDLEVWQRAMDLVDLVIEATRTLPPREFELRQQMRGAAISIPANIAEGWRRKNRRAAYQNHVSIAMGSQGELDTGLEIAFRQGWLDRESWKHLTALDTRVGRMLDNLHDALG